MKAKIDLAISFLSSMINQACGTLESELASHLKSVGECANPLVRAERLLDGLRQYAGPVAQATVRNRLAALAELKKMLQQVETNPNKELSYEFNIGRHGDDYAEDCDVSVPMVSEPIVESKLSGCTRELVCTLRLVEAQIEWLARENRYKAHFIIKAG
ncbi:MAG: hypothetical protein WC028_32080 [Candidatus Obscuribacterales bacterium]|jgi:hypothetical protein